MSHSQLPIDSACLCNNDGFADTAKNKLSVACPQAADLGKFKEYVNEQCKGIAGYPVVSDLMGYLKIQSCLLPFLSNLVDVSKGLAQCITILG
jgi:hypothetical protein